MFVSDVEINMDKPVMCNFMQHTAKTQETNNTLFLPSFNNDKLVL